MTYASWHLWSIHIEDDMALTGTFRPGNGVRKRWVGDLHTYQELGLMNGMLSLEFVTLGEGPRMSTSTP
jgi:hypothetical protein